jgi:hypothetical protein
MARHVKPTTSLGTGWKPNGRLQPMTNMNNPPLAALQSAIALSNDTGFRHEQPAHAATVRHFLDVSRAYLARRTSDFALEIRHLSSGACALPSTGHRHPVQQFQIGGEHVAR